MKRLLLLATVCLSLQANAQQTALCFRSTNGNFWKLSTVNMSDKAGSSQQISISTSSPRQTFKGWGTCFNELPWDAYNMLSDTQKELFANRLFAPDGDLRLTVGRIPVGASDYARDWYSSDEYDGDFNMEHFNIDRDLTTIIPSIKVAQALQPNMSFWASPWSPPQWMKTNKHYAQRRTNTNGCPFNVPPFDNDQFIDDARYYNAYCLYFSKFIDAYREQGINITGLAYQNEAYSNTPYPGCSWRAATTGKFLGQYLGPYFAEHQPGVQLIVGTMNTNRRDVYDTILKSEGVSKYCTAVGFQWEGGQRVGDVIRDYPDYEAVMTESECGSGTFDWAAAEHTFQLINHYLANKITTYTYWNAILKDKGISTWGWQQNSLVQVNSGTKIPRYTAEYYAFKHYSHLIPPGSKILTVDESQLLLSALTPDGNVVVVVGNEGTADKNLTLNIDGKYLNITVPVKSFASYVVGSDSAKQAVLASEARGLSTIEQASLSDAQQARLSKALEMSNNKEDNALDSLLAAVEDVESPSTKPLYAYTSLDNLSETEGYYLFDVTSSQFVNQRYRDTRTELNDNPTLPLTVAKDDDYYTLKKADGAYIKIGVYQGQYIWCDGRSGGPVDWTFTPNGDGTYTISMPQDIVSRDAAVAKGTYYLSGSNGTTAESAAHRYALVSAKDYAIGEARNVNVQQIPAALDMSQVSVSNTTNGNWNGDHLDWMDVGTVAIYKLQSTAVSPYKLSFQASSCKRNGATVNVEFINSNNAVAFSGSVKVANSNNNWSDFRDYSIDIPELPADNYTLMLTFTADAKSSDNIEGTANVKGLQITADGAATAIKSVNSNVAANSDAAYNLAGQRVGKDYKGIVIKNGRKYIVK